MFSFFLIVDCLKFFENIVRLMMMIFSGFCKSQNFMWKVRFFFFICRSRDVSKISEICKWFIRNVWLSWCEWQSIRSNFTRWTAEETLLMMPWWSCITVRIKWSTTNYCVISRPENILIKTWPSRCRRLWWWKSAKQSMSIRTNRWNHKRWRECWKEFTTRIIWCEKFIVINIFDILKWIVLMVMVKLYWNKSRIKCRWNVTRFLWLFCEK